MAMTRRPLTLRQMYRITRGVFLGLGIALAVFYWFTLTAIGAAPVDVHAYWAANPNLLYDPAIRPLEGGYNYSPAFELLVGWGRLLPFDMFVAIWRAAMLVLLVVLAGPLTLPLLLFADPVPSEVNAGNIQLLLAAAVVAGFRWSPTWVVVLLTKVTPGVGLLWFPLHRRWREFALALSAAAAITIVTFVIWPERWLGWFQLLTSGPPLAVAPFYLPLIPRLAVAIALLFATARRPWRWPAVAAAALALPAVFYTSPSMLVGVLPFARVAAGRYIDAWLERRGEPRLAAELSPASEVA